MSKQRVCYFWDCEELIPGNHFLCSNHHKEYRNRLLDRCAECLYWKYKEHDLCLACEQGWWDTEPQYAQEYSKAWEAGDADATEFFVYILKLDGGRFYAGQTRELRERIAEHRDGTTKSTAGKNPKLVWYLRVPTRSDATQFEMYLKQLCDENPREIRRWVTDFKDLIDLLDFS